jgi:hypothetical protein
MMALGLGLSFFAAVPFFAEPVTLPGFKIGEHLLPTPYLLPPVDGSLRLSLFKSRTQYPHLLTIKSNLFFDLIIRHLKSLLSISFNFSNISSSFNDNTHPFFCPQSSGSAQLSRILRQPKRRGVKLSKANTESSKSFQAKYLKVFDPFGDPKPCL